MKQGGGGAPAAGGMPDYVLQAMQGQQAAPPAPAIQQQTIGQAAKSVLAPLPSREFSDPKYWTENVPQSVARLPVAVAAGIGGMAYSAAKEFTDPFVNLLDSPKGLEDYTKAAADFAHAPQRAAEGLVHGVKEFVNAPLGLAEEQTASQAWDDPAASVLALSPFARPGMKVAKAAVPKNVGARLTKRSLQFPPSVDPIVQAKVADTVRKHGANITEAGLDKFKQDLRAKNQEIAKMIEPIADTPIVLDLAPALKNRIIAAEVSGTKGKDIKQATKYMEEFRRDHLVERAEIEQGGQKQIVEVPKELTLGKVQKLKQNINFQLKNYWKEKAKSGKSNDAKADAMKEVGDLLRAEVERLAPETKQLNKDVSDMIIARPFLQSAVNKAGSRQMISYRDLMAGGVAGAMLSPTASLPAIIVSKVLRDPRTQGRAGIVMYNVGEFAGKVKRMLAPGEANRIAAEIEPQVQPPPQGQLPPGQNQLALPAPRSVIELGEGPPAAAIHLGGPKAAPEMVPVEVSAYERLFQIAQSPEGKRLLVERLGREERHAKLVVELLKVPTTKALPPGQGFTMQEPIGPAPAPPPGGRAIRAENQQIGNPLSRGGY
jgi:hypothetical protein